MLTIFLLFGAVTAVLFHTEKEEILKYFSFNSTQNHFLWEWVGITFSLHRQKGIHNVAEFQHCTNASLGHICVTILKSIYVGFYYSFIASKQFQPLPPIGYRKQFSMAFKKTFAFVILPCGNSVAPNYGKATGAEKQFLFCNFFL